MFCFVVVFGVLVGWCCDEEIGKWLVLLWFFVCALGSIKVLGRFFFSQPQENVVLPCGTAVVSIGLKFDV